eukprot:3039914-Rhodomonas_salina.2
MVGGRWSGGRLAASGWVSRNVMSIPTPNPTAAAKHASRFLRLAFGHRVNNSFYRSHLGPSRTLQNAEAHRDGRGQHLDAEAREIGRPDGEGVEGVGAVEVDVGQRVGREVQLVDPELVRVERLELRRSLQHPVDDPAVAVPVVDREGAQVREQERELAVVRDVLQAHRAQVRSALGVQGDLAEADIDELHLLQLREMLFECDPQRVVIASLRCDGESLQVARERLDLSLEVRPRSEKPRSEARIAV